MVGAGMVEEETAAGLAAMAEAERTEQHRRRTSNCDQPPCCCCHCTSQSSAHRRSPASAERRTARLEKPARLLGSVGRSDSRSRQQCWRTCQWDGESALPSRSRSQTLGGGVQHNTHSWVLGTSPCTRWQHRCRSRRRSFQRAPIQEAPSPRSSQHTNMQIAECLATIHCSSPPRSTEC